MEDYSLNDPKISKIPFVLACNKFDLVSVEDNNENDLEKHARKEYLDNFAVEHGFKGVIRTSAKENFGVEEAFT